MSDHSQTKDSSQNPRRLSDASNKSDSSLLSILTIRTDKSTPEKETVKPCLTLKRPAIIVPLNANARADKIDVIAYPGSRRNSVRTYTQILCDCGKYIQFRADVHLSQPRVEGDIVSVSSGTPAAQSIIISSNDEEPPAIVINSTSSSSQMQESDCEPVPDKRDERIDEWVIQANPNQ